MIVRKGAVSVRVRSAETPSLLALVLTPARARSHSVAVRAGSQSMEYAELLQLAGRLAAGLQAAGMQRNDVIGLAAERDPWTIALILAVLQGGAAVLPLDANYPPARLEAMLEDAQPGFVVCTEHTGRYLPAGIRWCNREQLESRLAHAAAPVRGDMAYVLFTSGSTGHPKGVNMLNTSLMSLIAWHAAHPRLGKVSRTLQFAPLSFDVSFQEILSTLSTGGTLVLPTEAERRDPYALLDLITRERIDRIFLPYVALQALAEAVAAGGESPATLRDVITAGEQLRITPAIRALFVALPDCRLHNHYGPTETHVVTAHELSGDPAAWPELPPIGRPLPHVKTRLVDATLNSVEVGAEGELLLGGACLAAGYIHRPELTEERFITLDGTRWYRSGDRVRELGDGALDYLGRLDDQIKLDGYRIEPAEIEVVLCRHPAVAETAVIAADGTHGKRLVAHVVPRAAWIGDDALLSGLRAHCEAQLAPYLVPGDFVLDAALPLTPSGKIDRRALAHSTEEAPLIWHSDAPIEQQLAALWKQLLNLADLDPNANLFDLGARSLTVVRALTELRMRGFHTLTAVQIYEHPSVAKLAALMDATQAAKQATPKTNIQTQARAERQRGALLNFGPRPGARR